MVRSSLKGVVDKLIGDDARRAHTNSSLNKLYVAARSREVGWWGQKRRYI